MSINKIIILFSLLFSSISVSSELQRRASWEMSTEPPKSSFAGRVIKSINEDSPMQKAGFLAGDHLTSINGKKILNSTDWFDITDALVAGKTYSIRFNRNFKSSIKEVSFNPQDKEKHKNIETIYTQITSDFGIKQRAIITKPKSNKDKQPAILLLQGLSCSSVEINANRMNNWTRLINDIVEKSEHVVLRIEKPGMGDSEGNCSQTDFNTELNGYETAAKYLKTLPYVDTNNLIVYGNSMGSSLAPYIANKYEFSAVVSDGTFLRSWFEHMLEIERRILEFKGNTQAQITEKMNQSFLPLYYGMLVQKKSYEQIINEYPAIAKDNYHGLNHMYGRPMSYYQQLQNFDVAGEWQKLKVPARIRWGTNDWIMSEADNDMIIDILKKSGHKDHKLVKVENLDHWQAFHKSAKDSFDGKKGEWRNEISSLINKWFKELSNN